MVDCIKKIIEFRKDQIPPIKSIYLFASKTGERPYRGSDVIREFAKKAEVSDTSLFTFTHLRKQVATLSQTLQITKWEQDQLATFLGHDIRVRRSVYRQPLGVLDRAKVAKILLVVNKGVSIDFESGVDESDEISCEPLDENETDNEEELVNDGEIDDKTIYDSSTVTVTQRSSNIPQEEEEPKQCQSMKKQLEEIAFMKRSSQIFEEEEDETNHCKGKKTKKQRLSQTSEEEEDEPKQCKRKKMKRQPWSENEIAAVKRHLSHCIVSGNVPRKDQAMKTLAAEPCLRNRNWRNVKDFTYNLIKKQHK